MIMIPVLILQIFLFPIAVTSIMNVWVDSRRNLALQDAASHLGSAIQQLYFSMNHATVPPNTILTDSPGLPPFIEDHYYEANATLRTISQPALNSGKVLEITLSLEKAGQAVTTSVLLGSNTVWQDSTFVSNSSYAYITAQKFADQTISLRFGG
jgi:hypothetical protein